MSLSNWGNFTLLHSSLALTSGALAQLHCSQLQYEKKESSHNGPVDPYIQINTCCDLTVCINKSRAYNT